MKLRNLRKKVATFGVVSALSVLCLSYQNCSRPNFAIDEATKSKTLSETPVFGDNDRDPGFDPIGGGDRDPGVDPVTGMPRDPGVDPGSGTPRDPGKDPVTGGPRVPGIDPITGMPRIPGLDPITGMPRDPGTDPISGMPRDPGKDPVTGGPRDPGTDPTGTPRDPGTDPGGTPRDPGDDASAKFVNVEFVCPLLAHGAYKPLINTGELKAVVAQKMKFGLNQPETLCEVPDVKGQMISNRKIDISKCYNKAAKETNVYVVEKAVSSDFEKYAITMANSERLLGSLPLRVYYTDLKDKANQAGCDVVGDPLLVQLANDGKPQPISLTSAERGVMFDLLGKKNNYQQVQTAWFAESKSENYFLVLPDTNGDVKGIDQLFGDNTLGPDKKFSKQGFAALAKHDDNRDKVISDQDSVFFSLRLWKDDNLDGVAQKEELFTLDQKGVVAIDIYIDRKDRRYEERDIHGNMVKFKSVVVMKNGQYGLVYDLWLRYIIK
ncbi:hypothetical protein D3C87_1083590 [compost metagenome]